MIEAVQVPPECSDDNIEQHGSLAAWLMMNAGDRYWEVASHKGDIYITTLEGVMRADNGDWIIRGVKGELYPCKPDIFEATYEPA